MSGIRRVGGLALAVGMMACAVGCMHDGKSGPLGHGHFGRDAGPPTIAVPPPGSVPVELDKITLPPYVIEAPDQLLIEAFRRATVPDTDDKGNVRKDKDGKDLTREETQRLPVQAVTGTFQVRPDGTVSLGFWGSVPVSGLTLEDAATAIRAKVVGNEVLKQFGTKPESVFVIVDVLAYNSKRYYVITDGGGPSAGEQVVSFPVTGSETVMDAIANVGGLSDVSSKRNIWVARRTPHAGQPWQILPVDWVGMTQHGITCTNYQIMPGDRIYVKSQRLVSIDRTMARIISPFERAFGITLLGTSVVNQISGRGINGNGTNN
jgi:polysaccharide export outer membrane protein